MDAKLIPVRITIRRTTDGEARSYDDELYVTEDYDGTFIWEEGNYACDCNRFLFFERAIGIEPLVYDEEGRAPKALNPDDRCGHNLYIVESIVRASDNVTVYAEDAKRERVVMNIGDKIKLWRPEYRSSRDIPLVLSSSSLANGIVTEPTVTVEFYEKWYDIFVVRPMGFDGCCIEQVPFPGDFCDHVPNPKSIQTYAKENNLAIDSMALEMIVGRWEIEIAERYPEPT